MDFIIWFSQEESKYILGRQVSRNVFECDKTEYLRILYRFGPDKSEDAQRILDKLNSASGNIFSS